MLFKQHNWTPLVYNYFVLCSTLLSFFKTILSYLKILCQNTTERLLRLRRRFTEKTELSPIQAGRLKKIDKAIEGLGFTTAHWDEEYARYLRMRREVERESEVVTETPELKQIRKERAKAIVQRMLAAEGEENNK